MAGVVLVRCARPNVRGVSTYTILGFAGYIAATALAVYLGDVWRLALAERLVACIAPPAAFVLAVAITAAIAGEEKIVLYEVACAAVGTTAVIAAIAGLGVARLVDVVTLGIGVFLVFGRLGCFAVACCHGTPGHGVAYGAAHVAVGFWSRWSGRALWPIQLVEALASAVLVAGALIAATAPGDAAVVYIAGYACVRFPLELARGDAARPYALGVSEAQWFAVATLGVCALWRPQAATFALFGAVLIATAALVATRRHRELVTPAHLYELDEVMAGLSDGARAETSRGVSVSRHALGAGRIDWVLSSSHPRWSVATARAIAGGLWSSFELIEGRTPGVIHVIAA